MEPLALTLRFTPSPLRTRLIALVLIALAGWALIGAGYDPAVTALAVPLVLAAVADPLRRLLPLSPEEESR